MEKLVDQVSLRASIVSTAVVFLSVLAEYMTISGVAVSLRHLCQQMDSDVESMSLGMTLNAAFSCIASLTIVPLLTAYFRDDILFTASLLIVAFDNLIFGLSSNLILFYAATAINGMGAGVIEVLSNSYISRSWHHRKRNVMLQLLHAALAFGPLASSLLFAPFLDSDVDQNSKVQNFNASLIGNATLATNATQTPGHLDLIEPFAIITAVVTASAVAVYLTWNHEADVAVRNDVEVEEVKKTASTLLSLERKEMLIVILLCLVVLFSALVTGSVGVFLPLFLTSVDLGISESKAANMMSVFNAALTSGRIVFAMLAAIIAAEHMLITCFLLSLLSYALLAIFANSSITMIWISIAITGFCSAPITPAIFAFAGSIINSNSDSLFAVLVFCCNTMAVLDPLILGPLIQNIPMSFVWLNMIGLSAALIILHILMRNKPHHDACCQNDFHVKKTSGSEQ